MGCLFEREHGGRAVGSVGLCRVAGIAVSKHGVAGRLLLPSGGTCKLIGDICWCWQLLFV